MSRHPHHEKLDFIELFSFINTNIRADIYCQITAYYNDETITIRFKGTKIIGIKYKWNIENEDVFDAF